MDSKTLEGLELIKILKDSRNKLEQEFAVANFSLKCALEL